jgi:hypothetical protein
MSTNQLSFTRSELQKRHESVELLASLWSHLIPDYQVPDYQLHLWVEGADLDLIEMSIRRTAKKRSKLIASGEGMSPTYVVRYCQACISRAMIERYDGQGNR